jgi:hypothetical protein
MNVQTIENLLLNHQFRFPNDTAITKAAHVAKEAMYHSVRTHMEQGLINLVWKHFNGLEVTEDDFEVIASFNHWYNLSSKDQLGELNRYLGQQVQLSQVEVFEAFEQLQNHLPNYRSLAIEAFEALGGYVLTESERNALSLLHKLTTPGMRISEKDLEEVRPLNLCDEYNPLEQAAHYIKSLDEEAK